MRNVGDDDFAPEIEYSEDLKKEFLDIIEKSYAGKTLSNREISMLFFWTRHMDEPRFDFAEKYRHSRKTAKKGHTNNRAKKERSK